MRANLTIERDDGRQVRLGAHIDTADVDETTAIVGLLDLVRGSADDLSARTATSGIDSLGWRKGSE